MALDEWVSVNDGNAGVRRSLDDPLVGRMQKKEGPLGWRFSREEESGSNFRRYDAIQSITEAFAAESTPSFASENGRTRFAESSTTQ